MFGKLIKNEFVNRAKSMIALFAGLLIGSIVVFLMNILADSIDSNFINILSGVTVFVFIIGFFVSGACIFILPLDDFRKRFFKDQGYLTHTLPVKTSHLLLARTFCDITMVVGMAIVFPLSICIASGEPDFFKAFIDFFEKLLSYVGINVSFTLTILLLLVTYLSSYLFVVWCFNFSYAFGHCLFKHGKRLMSVVCFLGLSIVSNVLTSYLAQAMDKTDLFTKIYKATGDKLIASTNIVLLITSAYMILCTGILIALTNRIFKKHLNLE